jgi:hypothetical protein
VLELIVRLYLELAQVAATRLAAEQRDEHEGHSRHGRKQEHRCSEGGHEARHAQSLRQQSSKLAAPLTLMILGACGVISILLPYAAEN